jgi:hypothetical protein
VPKRNRKITSLTLEQLFFLAHARKNDLCSFAMRAKGRQKEKIAKHKKKVN